MKFVPLTMSFLLKSRVLHGVSLISLSLLSSGAIAQPQPAQPAAVRPQLPASTQLPAPAHAPALRFGVSTHLRRLSKGWTPDLLPMIRAMGVGGFRDDDPWANVEKQKGVYQPSSVLEEAITNANTMKLEPLLLLLYENKLYGDGYDAQAFARYANWMIDHYQGRIKYFEIWNEPDNFGFRKVYGGEWNGRGKGNEEGAWVKKFADFATVVGREIKKQHPEVKLVGYSAIAPSTHRLFKYPELWKNLDILSIHPYPMKVPPEISGFGGKTMQERDGVSVADDDHSFTSLIRRFREGLAQAGRPDMPIWITEVGYTTAQLKTKNIWVGFTENAQAIYNVRLGILAAGNGIDRTFFYDFLNDGKNRNETEENYGLVREDYTPKPSYFALQHLCALMPGDTKPTTIPVKIDRLWPRPNYDGVEWDNAGIKITDAPQTYSFVQPDGTRVVFLWRSGRIYGDAQEELANVTVTLPQGTVAEVGRVASREKLSPKISRQGQNITLTELPYGSDPVYILVK